MEINAFVLEQPSADGITGNLFRVFGLLLDAKTSYEPFFVMGDNSVALVMLDEEAFKHMDGVDGEVLFMNAFPEAIKSRLNDMPEKNPEHVNDIPGLKDVGIKISWIREDDDVKRLSMNKWYLTDYDCGQWRRQINSDQFELVQVVTLPDGYSVAHSFIYLSDYTKEEKENILRFFDYNSWEHLVQLTGSELAAEETFAECAFETEALENLTAGPFETLNEAEAKVVEILDK